MRSFLFAFVMVFVALMNSAIAQQPSPKSEKEARAILQKAIRTRQGKSGVPLSAVSVRLNGKGPNGQVQNVELKTNGPQRMFFSAEVKGTTQGKIKVAINGKSARITFGNQTLPAPEQTVSQFWMIHSSTGFPDFQAILAEENYQLSVLPKDRVKGGQVGVLVKMPKRGEAEFVFTKKTMLLAFVKMKRTNRTPGGPAAIYFQQYVDADSTSREKRILRQAGVPTEGKALLRWLANHGISKTKESEIAKLIADLGSDSFRKRAAAVLKLKKAGPVARPQLEQAAKSDDLEIAGRAKKCLSVLQQANDDNTIRAAVWILAMNNPKGTTKALFEYLPKATKTVRKDIQAALVSLVKVDGRANPVVLQYLKSKTKLHRVVAAEILGKDGGRYLKRPGRRLVLRGVQIPTAWKMVTEITKGNTQEGLGRFEAFEFYNSFSGETFNLK